MRLPFGFLYNLVWLNDFCYLLIIHCLFQDDIANNDKDKIIIFVETKRKADELTVRMRAEGFPAMCIHGDKQQKEREWVLNEFKNGATTILVIYCCLLTLLRQEVNKKEAIEPIHDSIGPKHADKMSLWNWYFLPLIMLRDWTVIWYLCNNTNTCTNCDLKKMLWYDILKSVLLFFFVC